jgi:hypothetical protein
MHTSIHAVSTTSAAYLAAGMTSRARRPLGTHPAG